MGVCVPYIHVVVEGRGYIVFTLVVYTLQTLDISVFNLLSMYARVSLKFFGSMNSLKFLVLIVS